MHVQQPMRGGLIAGSGLLEQYADFRFVGLSHTEHRFQGL